MSTDNITGRGNFTDLPFIYIPPVPLPEGHPDLDQATTWKLRIVAEIEISSAPYPPDDEDAKTWLINDILLGDVNGLVLHSNEIGDEVGVVRISEVTEWTS